MRCALGWLAALLVLTSCGYKSGFTLPDNQNLGVRVFGNESLLRDVELRLHPFLTDSVQRLVSADLVGPAQADLWIEGEVLEYSRRGGIRSRQNVLQERGVRITVRARLVRRLREHPEGLENEVVREVTLSDDRGYLVEDARGESDAVDNALRNISDRVVLDLFADLAYEDAPEGDLSGRR